MYLSRLICYSRIVVDANDRNAFKEIKTILKAAAERNQEMGITGGLLFDKVYFAQALEGDRKAVTDTFCSTIADPRHQDVVILEAKPIDQRRFLNWNIGFAGRSETAKQKYVKFGSSKTFDPAKMTAESLLGFMDEIVTEEDAFSKMFTRNPDTKQKTAA